METTAKDLLKKVRRIEISTRKIVETMLSGQYHTKFKGQGMQFAEFREYYAGDDIRHIDWKVTARTQSTHIKKFEEERDLTIYFLIDVSHSGRFGTGEKSVREALAEVSALLAFAAVKNNDKVGLVLFSDKIERHIPPKKGRSHAMRLVSEILGFSAVQGKTDIHCALDFYSQVMKHSGVVFLASDFIDSTTSVRSNYEKIVKKVSSKHDLIALRMRDLREKEVPRMGVIEMQDPETSEVFWVDTSSYLFQKSFKEKRESFDRKVSSLIKSAGADFLELWTNEDYFSKVIQFFRSRR